MTDGGGEILGKYVGEGVRKIGLIEI